MFLFFSPLYMLLNYENERLTSSKVINPSLSRLIPLSCNGIGIKIRSWTSIHIFCSWIIWSVRLIFWRRLYRRSCPLSSRCCPRTTWLNPWHSKFDESCFGFRRKKGSNCKFLSFLSFSNDYQRLPTTSPSYSSACLRASQNFLLLSSTSNFSASCPLVNPSLFFSCTFLASNGPR